MPGPGVRRLVTGELPTSWTAIADRSHPWRHPRCRYALVPSCLKSGDRRARETLIGEKTHLRLRKTRDDVIVSNPRVIPEDIPRSIRRPSARSRIRQTGRAEVLE
jgi:hypothetical protein